MNQCIDGTHNCTSKENCIITPKGFECHPRQVVSPLAMIPENLTKSKKKHNCDIGYVYNVYEQKCIGNINNLFLKIKFVKKMVGKLYVHI